MMGAPLVSVAIITYNQKEYLKECIESVMQQDYENFQIVVADDASTDGSQDLLIKYYNEFPGKFKLELAKNNRGITENSNAAHKSCEGTYVAWMGGDDLMLPGKLSRQVEFMRKNPDCDVCYHDLEIFDSDSLNSLGLFSGVAKPRSGYLRDVIKYGCFMGACSVMVRRDKAPEYGFDRRIPIASDWLYYIRTLQHGGSIQFIPSVLGKYRRHKGNITKRNDLLGVRDTSVQDHFITCAVVLSEFPEFEREVRKRLADLLFLCRNVEHGRKGFSYVWAGVKFMFGLKPFLRLLKFAFRLK